MLNNHPLKSFWVLFFLFFLPPVSAWWKLMLVDRTTLLAEVERLDWWVPRTRGPSAVAVESISHLVAPSTGERSLFVFHKVIGCRQEIPTWEEFTLEAVGGSLKSSGYIKGLALSEASNQPNWSPNLFSFFSLFNHSAGFVHIITCSVSFRHLEKPDGGEYWSEIPLTASLWLMTAGHRGF